MNVMTQMATRKEQGFTLIELVMVIVILGILAAFALPRFANLGGDARRATIEGAEGAIKSANAIVRSACLADANCSTTAADTITLEGSAITTEFGYPDATQTGILDAAQITGADFTIVAGNPIIVRATGATTPANCQVSFTEAADATTPPVIAVDVTDC